METTDSITGQSVGDDNRQVTIAVVVFIVLIIVIASAVVLIIVAALVARRQRNSKKSYPMDNSKAISKISNKHSTFIQDLHCNHTCTSAFCYR